jgi:hypothetical protein
VKDTRNDGTISLAELLFASLNTSIKNDDWKIVTAEDWLLRPSLKKKITDRICEALQRVVEAETLSPDIAGPENSVQCKASEQHCFQISLRNKDLRDDD